MENQSSQPNPKRTSPIPERKPWPMWPIALSILTFIIFYTWVQLKFRKDEKPYEPNYEMQERRNQVAEKNLYDWFSLSVNPSAQAEGYALSSSDITTRFISGPLENELPSQIVYYIPRRPILVPKLESLKSQSSFSTKQPIKLQVSLPGAFGDSPDFHLSTFYKEGELIILAEMRVENDKALDAFETEGPSKTYLFEIGTDPIETERVNAKFYFEGQVREWTLDRFGEPIEE
ncbi:MAG: hypothetical protein OSB19_05630 [Opitutaceae bacterium]|jgi:hypothetical protein|nr:hypothetical protein [Opitutaceae bacterium]